jgi:hypothetical protein
MFAETTRKIRLAALAGIFALTGSLCWSCGEDEESGVDAGADTDTDTDTDTDADADAGADAGASGYDFEAAAPWYICPTEALPADAVVVTAFDRVDQYFGDTDFRTVRTEVELPTDTDWSQIGLWFELECPESGDCDDWDRVGSLQLVLNPEDDASEWKTLELARHVTPYNRGMCQFIDVTKLASLLSGTRTLISFIDTWVGPGNAAGDGWRVTVKLVYFPGEAAPANDVIDIWGNNTITVGEADAGATVSDQVETVVVPIPAEATQVLAHLTTTGHSFGNTGNCAEFCEMRQDIYVNGTLFSENPWRADCDANPVSPQDGTWKYDRNGWCPGSIAVGQIVDITDAVDPGVDNEIDFDIRLANGEEYVNESPVDLLPYEIVGLKLYVFGE